jgi:integrase
MTVEVRPTNPTIRAQRPHLLYVCAFYEAGTKHHRFFTSKVAADLWAKERNKALDKLGVEGVEFPELKSFGKTLRDAVQHYVAYLKATERSCTAEQLVDKLLAAKRADGAKEGYLRFIRTRLNVFAKAFADRNVSTITTNEIDDWLRSLPHGRRTRNHYRQHVVLLFNHAVRAGYATANPATNAVKVKVAYTEPGILTVDETARLLDAAPLTILPAVAIGAFAGLRRAEIDRLDWSEVDFESGLIEIKAAKAKTGARRFVTIQSNLREWLLPLRQHKGNVTPEGFRVLFKQARAAAGIKQWPDNALRHSFASYHLAHFNNAALTSMQLGHLDSGVTYAHYRQLVTPKNAERYWNLRPSASASEKVVQLAAPR